MHHLLSWSTNAQTEALNVTSKAILPLMEAHISVVKDVFYPFTISPEEWGQTGALNKSDYVLTANVKEVKIHDARYVSTAEVL